MLPPAEQRPYLPCLCSGCEASGSAAARAIGAGLQRSDPDDVLFLARNSRFHHPVGPLLQKGANRDLPRCVEEPPGLFVAPVPPPTTPPPSAPPARTAR